MATLSLEPDATPMGNISYGNHPPRNQHYLQNISPRRSLPQLPIAVPGPMAPHHRQLLEHFRLDFLDNIDLQDSSVLDVLMAGGIINEQMRDRILAQDSRKGRVALLLDKLKLRGARAFPMFLEALEHDYDFLAARLQEADTIEYIHSGKPPEYESPDKVTKVLRHVRVHPIQPVHSSDYIYIDGNLEEQGYTFNKLPFRNTKDKGDGATSRNVTEPYLALVITENVMAMKIECPLPNPSQNQYRPTNTGDLQHQEASNCRELDTDDIYEELGNPDSDPSQSTRGSFRIRGSSSHGALLEGKVHEGEPKILKNPSLRVSLIPSNEPSRDCESKMDYCKGPQSRFSNTETQQNPSMTCNFSEFLPVHDSEMTPWRLLKGELVFASKTEYNGRRSSKITVFDRKGQRIQVQRAFICLFGDPHGEPWFYPIPISSRQAMLHLSRDKRRGTFLVYKPPHTTTNVVYNLSLLRDDGRVSHHHIVHNENDEVGFKDNLWFLTVHDLVQYHKQDRGSLACRLRYPAGTLNQDDANQIRDSCPEDTDISIRDIQFDTSKPKKGFFKHVSFAVYADQEVAVKFLVGRKSYKDDENFLEEAKTILGLDHPNIVHALGVCLEGPLAIITEWASGGDLLEQITSSVLDINNTFEVVELCKQVFSALDYLKQHNFILHRDVAARNCLLQNDGRTLKLADFGMARKVSSDKYHAEESDSMPVRWSAPEVLIHMTYCTKSDIWAAGVLAWEILSGGKIPFSDLSISETIHHVCLGGRLNRPEACPEKLFVLLQQCWLTSPEERRSAEEMIEAFNLMLATGFESDPPIEDFTEEQNADSAKKSKASKRLQRWFKWKSQKPSSPGQPQVSLEPSDPQKLSCSSQAT